MSSSMSEASAAQVPSWSSARPPAAIQAEVMDATASRGPCPLGARAWACRKPLALWTLASIDSALHQVLPLRSCSERDQYCPPSFQQRRPWQLCKQRSQLPLHPEGPACWTPGPKLAEVTVHARTHWQHPGREAAAARSQQPFQMDLGLLMQTLCMKQSMHNITAVLFTMQLCFFPPWEDCIPFLSVQLRYSDAPNGVKVGNPAPSSGKTFPGSDAG